MFHPLEDNAQLVQSWGDIFRSQWSHYFTWGGRTVAHTLAQWVLWQGKWLFDILNSFAFVLLLLLIYWHSLGGKVTGHLRPTRLFFIFLCVWAFVPALPTVLFWVLGACNYLWMLDILLVFLLPYVRHFFQRGTGGKWWQAAVMLPFGVIGRMRIRSAGASWASPCMRGSATSRDVYQDGRSRGSLACAWAMRC